MTRESLLIEIEEEYEDVLLFISFSKTTQLSTHLPKRPPPSMPQLVLAHSRSPLSMQRCLWHVLEVVVAQMHMSQSALAHSVRSRCKGAYGTCSGLLSHKCVRLIRLLARAVRPRCKGAYGMCSRLLSHRCICLSWFWHTHNDRRYRLEVSLSIGSFYEG